MTMMRRIDLVPVGNALRATAAPSSDREGSIDLVPVGNALRATVSCPFLQRHCVATAARSVGTKGTAPPSDRDGSIDLVPVGNALRATAAPSSDREGSIEVEAWQIRTIRAVANPEKLTHV